jgi:5-methyltetrahydrofolate--homocysteine methyltransferase
MPQDIIIDPNILAIATGMEEHDRYALDFIRATKWIHDNLPGAHVSGGVSNLSFSFRGNNYIREAMHSVFLYHAIQAGMDFGIVNPSTKIQYSDIPEEQLTVIEDAILYRHEGASEALIELANELNAQKQSVEQNAANLLDNNAQQTVPAWRSETIEQRLSYALRKGIGDYLEEDQSVALSGAGCIPAAYILPAEKDTDVRLNGYIMRYPYRVDTDAVPYGCMGCR